MNVIDLLPSPQQYFSLAVTLLQSTVDNYARKPVPRRRAPVDFDVDVNTGFFPRSPLPHLSGAFEVWETALRDAGEKLSLGEDDSEAALSMRGTGELWRSQVLSVSQTTMNALVTDSSLMHR